MKELIYNGIHLCKKNKSYRENESISKNKGLTDNGQPFLI